MTADDSSRQVSFSISSILLSVLSLTFLSQCIGASILIFAPLFTTRSYKKTEEVDLRDLYNGTRLETCAQVSDTTQFSADNMLNDHTMYFFI